MVAGQKKVFYRHPVRSNFPAQMRWDRKGSRTAMIQKTKLMVVIVSADIFYPFSGPVNSGA